MQNAITRTYETARKNYVALNALQPKAGWGDPFKTRVLEWDAALSRYCRDISCDEGEAVQKALDVTGTEIKQELIRQNARLATSSSSSSSSSSPSTSSKPAAVTSVSSDDNDEDASLLNSQFSKRWHTASTAKQRVAIPSPSSAPLTANDIWDRKQREMQDEANDLSQVKTHGAAASVLRILRLPLGTTGNQWVPTRYENTNSEIRIIEAGGFIFWCIGISHEARRNPPAASGSAATATPSYTAYRRTAQNQFTYYGGAWLSKDVNIPVGVTAISV